MNNGYSSLFKNLTANLFAAIVLLFGAVFCFISGFAGWISVRPFVIALILFFIEKNPYVRKASFIVALASCAAFFSWLLFVVILCWPFFNVLNWIIDILLMLVLIFLGLCAFNGKDLDLPLVGKFIDSVCNK